MSQSLDMFTVEQVRKQVRRLSTVEGFDKRFHQLTMQHDTYEEAYEALEAEYRFIFGRRRYKNYESYRKSKSKRIER